MQWNAFFFTTQTNCDNVFGIKLQFKSDKDFYHLLSVLCVKTRQLSGFSKPPGFDIKLLLTSIKKKAYGKPKDDTSQNDNTYYTVVEHWLYESVDRHFYHSFLSHSNLRDSKHSFYLASWFLILHFHDLCFILQENFYFYYYMLYHLSASEIVCGQWK